MYSPSRAVTIANRIVTLLFALALITVVVVVFDAASGGLYLPMQVPPDQLSGLPPATEFAGWPDVRYHLVDPSAGQRVMYVLQQLAPLLLVIPGLWLLRGFLRSVLAGEPFGSENARRLRIIALLLLVGAPFVALAQYMLRNALFNDLHVDLASKGYAVPGAAMVAGLGVYVLAEVFAYGMRLREDVEATI